MRTYSTSSGSDLLSSFDGLTISTESAPDPKDRQSADRVSSSGDDCSRKQPRSASPATAIAGETSNERSRQPMSSIDVRAWAKAHATDPAAVSYLGAAEAFDSLIAQRSSLSASDLNIDDQSDSSSDVTATLGRSGSARLTGICFDDESVMSMDDARSSIDAFFAKDQQFLGKASNKLRLWQALCIEFGLCEPAPGMVDLAAHFNGAASPTASVVTRSAPARCEKYHPLPQSCTAADKLLKQHVHVNIRDYIEARQSGGSDFDHLLFPKPKALITYTRKTKRFAKKQVTKNLWLQAAVQDSLLHEILSG